MKRVCLLILLFNVLQAYAQKLPFENFSVDKGLIQSQAQAFCQDQQHHLWIGTFGGLDRFDGSNFRHFTTQEGLLSGAVSCLYTASDGTIWIGGFKGITAYNGKKFINYPFAGNPPLTISSMTQDDAGNTWAFGFKPRLLMIKNGKLQDAPLPFDKAIPTCLYKAADGKLLVYFYQQGLYTYSKQQWKKETAIASFAIDEFIIHIKGHNDNLYFITNKKTLYRFHQGKVTAYSASAFSNAGDLAVIRNELWIGTGKGIQVYNPNDLTLLRTMDAAAGLTDNFVNKIFADADGNTWIATDGEGIFRYTGGAFQKLDKSSGLPGNVVMGLVAQSDGVYIGTRENGTVLYNTLTKTIQPLQGNTALTKTGVNCLGAGENGSLYLGTMDNRLFRYYQGRYSEIILDALIKPMVNTLAFRDNTLWAATTNGIYKIKNGSVTKIRTLTDVCISVLPLGNDAALATTMNGLYDIKDTLATKVENESLAKEEINCIIPYKNYFLAGINHHGFCVWDRANNKMYYCDTRNGLADNIVFSLLVDSSQSIWAGTGTSLHKIQFNENKKTFTVRQFTKADGYEHSENNLNTLLTDNSGRIWAGTTKGAFICEEKPSPATTATPYAVIQQVSFSGIQDSAGKHATPWYQLPENLQLNYRGNSISFTVKGIYPGNPDDMYYSTKLVGYDQAFTLPSKDAFFNYRNLEPGSYVFQVKAVTGSGVESGNIAEYPFVIRTPFTKSTGFFILIIATLIGAGVFVQQLITKLKHKQRLKFAALQKEEQDKIRQRTAEDFHDELGNRLTRISLLADIVQHKLPVDDEEKRKLLMQLQENAKALYSGTKDIIWSLTPASDNFKEVMAHILQFANELFNDTHVEFTFTGMEHIPASMVLPPDYNRNLVMISKEILNNSLRYAACTKAGIILDKTGDDTFVIRYYDNGNGFAADRIKRGNGISNIQRRAERMQTHIELESETGKGTAYILNLKIPQKGG